MWRNFAVNDEGGVVICTYPDEKSTPAIPIPYCEEAMTGFEYAFAGLLLSEYQYDKAENVVRAIRERYDGEKRNPWSEIECGSNYARSMASYALLNIYSGFACDVPKGFMRFRPLRDGKYPWSAFGTWGVADVGMKKCKIEVYGEPLHIKYIGVWNAVDVKNIKIDGKDVNCRRYDGEIMIFDSIKKTFEIEY